MQRREFLTVAGAVLSTRKWEVGTRNDLADAPFRVPRSPFRVAPWQEPTLSPEALARRIARAQAELKTRKWDLLIATPGTTDR